MREILTLSGLEHKVGSVIHDQLRFDVSDEHTILLPSLLWSHLALGWTSQPNNEFWQQSFRTILANKTPLTYSSKVLLSQVFNDCEFSKLCDPDAEFVAECRNLHHHYELLDIRENSKHYRKVYGVDVAAEIQRVLNTESLTSLYNDKSPHPVQVKELNSNCDGYLMLAKMNSGKFISLTNKLDTLANGKHLTGYHLIKRQQ
jgi:hypothetical protein